jgi:DNA-binding winged helix-turn-helix (wHTH) protein
LDNAAKYSAESSPIEIEVERADSRAAIRVRDRGQGIPPSEHRRIFHKFVRGEAAMQAGIRGTGVGLAMVGHIVAAHNGEIKLESNPGEGSSFTLLLPAVVDMAKSSLSKMTGHCALIKIKNELVLEGYEVDVASRQPDRFRTGPRRRVRPHPADIMLPRRTATPSAVSARLGFERRFSCLHGQSSGSRKCSVWNSAPTTMSPSHSVRWNCAPAFARCCASPDAQEVYRFGDVELDLTRADCSVRDGMPVETTTLEFKLLATFVRKRGRILTREQLLDEVWRPDSSPSDRVIDNHIMNLRRKVEPDPQQPRFLVSVRGMGYRFDG